MESQTPLKVIKNKFGLPGLKDIFIKDESFNATGTIKDRRNRGLLEEALKLRIDKLVLITSGNNGYSLAKLAKDQPIKIVSIVSKDLETSIKNQLERICYQVIEINLNHKILRPEEIMSFAREHDEEVIWDVTNGYESYYLPIFKEILYEFQQPDYIVTPVGSGGIFVAMAEAAEMWNPHTKIIGIGVKNQYKSLADKLHTPWSPYTKSIEAYKNKGHFVYRLGEAEIKETYKKYKDIVECEISSSVVFAAPSLHKFKPSDKVVFINTGKSKIN